MINYWILIATRQKDIKKIIAFWDLRDIIEDRLFVPKPRMESVLKILKECKESKDKNSFIKTVEEKIVYESSKLLSNRGSSLRPKKEFNSRNIF